MNARQVSLVDTARELDQRLKTAAQAATLRRSLVAGALPRVADAFRDLQDAGVGKVLDDVSRFSSIGTAVALAVGYAEWLLAVLVVEPTDDGHLKGTAHLMGLSRETEIVGVDLVEPGPPDQVTDAYRALIASFLDIVQRRLGRDRSDEAAMVGPDPDAPIAVA